MKILVRKLNCGTAISDGCQQLIIIARFSGSGLAIHTTPRSSKQVEPMQPANEIKQKNEQLAQKANLFFVIVAIVLPAKFDSSHILRNPCYPDGRA